MRCWPSPVPHEHMHKIYECDIKVGGSNASEGRQDYFNSGFASLLVLVADSPLLSMDSTWPTMVGSASDTTGGPVNVFLPRMKYHTTLMAAKPMKTTLA